MNWYKLSKKLELWEMTREEYNSIPYPPLKPNKIFYVNVYGSDVEVIQNPTGSDIRQMSKEVISDNPMFPLGVPKLRSTQDENGNKYYWKASEAVHAHIEPLISKIINTELNQNAERLPYYMYIYQALKAKKPVPNNIFNEFAQRYPDAVRKFK